MSEKQKTIGKPVALSGIGLHTGHEVSLRLLPAGADEGIQFIRTDLAQRPRIKVGYDTLLKESEVGRCTSIGINGAVIHTVEHFMSALFGLGIDNIIVEIKGDELPGLDGSSIGYVRALREAGIVKQDAPRACLYVKAPVSVVHDGASILIVPDTKFRITYTLDYPRSPVPAQVFSTTVSEEIYERDIAPCRTFCLEEEAQKLRQMGLGQGASHDNTLVIGKDGVIGNTVRFPDEFARHKVLDIIGDLYLLGRPIRGSIFAVKSGHRLNTELLKRVFELNGRATAPVEPQNGKVPKELDINQVMEILPHRFPFLLVDRIVELEPGRRAVGIKNVTINDPFFRGHFPSKPVMPGVLMVEALAQAGGVMVLTSPQHCGKLALFMAADKVKFRKLVEPGDRLYLDVEMVRDRDRTACLRGKAKVNGEVVVEADLMFSFTEKSFLG